MSPLLGWSMDGAALGDLSSCCTTLRVKNSFCCAAGSPLVALHSWCLFCCTAMAGVCSSSLTAVPTLIWGRSSCIHFWCFKIQSANGGRATAAVLVREKGMAGVLCDLPQWQRAPAIVTRAMFSSVPGWCRTRKILKLSFLVTRVVFGIVSRSSGLRKKAGNCIGLLFLCYFFAFVLFGVFLVLVLTSALASASASFFGLFLFLKSFNWSDQKAPYLFCFTGFLAVMCF